MTQTVARVEPADATSLKELNAIVLHDDEGNSTTINRGDAVALVHEPSGSRAVGVLGNFFGVGRVRGVSIEGTVFGSRLGFYFGQPEDKNDGFSLEKIS